MTKPSINWDHVAPEFVAMATDSSKVTLLHTSIPAVSGGVYWHGDVVYEADAFASFIPGTCDWRDSLVIRPGYEETGE